MQNVIITHLFFYFSKLIQKNSEQKKIVKKLNRLINQQFNLVNKFNKNKEKYYTLQNCYFLLCIQ